MNAAARIVCGLQKFDNITNHIHDTLHWLQVPQRVKFKLCLLTYKAMHGLAHNYLSELCTPVASVDSRNHMRSASAGDLVIPNNNIICQPRICVCWPSGLEQKINKKSR